MRLAWSGPFQIKTYLANSISREAAWAARWPRERDAVYLVSEHKWHGAPKDASHVLYVGGNTGKSSRFLTRIGDLVADLYGFFGEETGHHSGGITLWKWCEYNRVHPGELWLAWATSKCAHCAERFLVAKFPRAKKNDFADRGLRNKITPPRCRLHSM